MYNNTYGNQVFKRYQIHMGNPFNVKQAEAESDIEEDNDAVEPSSEEIADNILNRAQLEAAALTAEAEKEADRLIKEAKDEIGRQKEEAKQKAKEEGYRHGEELARKHYQDLINEAEFIRQHAQTEYRDVMQGIEQDAVSMILDIARKIIGSEINDHPDAILSMIRETFQCCSRKDTAILKVSAADYDYVEQNKEEILQRVPDIKELDIIRDGSLPKGSCLVETPYGTVDGSWQTRFEMLESQFLELIAHSE